MKSSICLGIFHHESLKIARYAMFQHLLQIQAYFRKILQRLYVTIDRKILKSNWQYWRIRDDNGVDGTISPLGRGSSEEIGSESEPYLEDGQPKDHSYCPGWPSGACSGERG